MKAKIISIYSLLLGGLIAFWSCEKSEPTAFNSKAAIIFDYSNSVGANKINFSFLGKPEQIGEIRIPVIVNGFPEDKDRVFEVKVITDTITNAESADYQIEQGIVHAGKVRDTLIIKVPKTEKLETEVLRLFLQVKESNDFDAGIIERQFIEVSWSNQAIMPTWGVYFRTFFSSVGSTKAYRIFVETTGLTNFAAADFRPYGQAGAEVLGKKFGDYIRAWNAANPNEILKHDDGTQKGNPIVPRY